MAKRIPPRLGDHSDSAPLSARWQLGEFELDEQRRELKREGLVLDIEPKPLHLLMLLVRHPGELITKEELVDRLWGGRTVSETAVARCVTKLRAALGERQSWVRTIHGYGYRFDGWVEPLEAAAPLLDPGSAVAAPTLPGRPGWQLQLRLGEGRDTWLGTGPQGQQAVFKLARDAASLTALKREAAVHRLLAASAEAAHIRTVPLLDFNFHAAPYFLEFDYCRAGNLAEWWQRHGSALLRQERLALVADLARQLSALHALGVLHKDFKPANVLVRRAPAGALPELALADFGNGGVMNPERLRALGITRLGLTLSALEPQGGSGTPLYLAPEVMAGQPWTRQADLYALGVLLYQLLIDDLRRPLAPGWERDLDDPLLIQDIAAACDQSPQHRLLDAQELALRLESLDERRRQQAALTRAAAEAARQQQALRRAQARRRLLGAVVAVLLLGTAVSTALFVEARQAQRQAESASATAEAVTAFLDDSVLGAADPYRAGGGRNVTVVSVLDKAVQDFGRLSQQPALQLRLGRTLTGAYHNLGLEPQAREIGHATLAAASAGRLPANHPELNRLREQLGWIELDLARYAESQQLFDALLRHSDTDATRHRATYGLARLEFERGYFARATERYRALLAEAEAVADRSGIDADFLADVRWDLAEAEFETHEWEQAGAHLDAVQADFRSRVAPDNVRQLWLNISVAYRRMMLEDFSGAEALLRETLARANTHLSPEHPVAMTALHHLAAIHNKRGEAKTALPLIDTVLAWRLRHYGESHYITRMSMGRRAEALLLLGRAPEAEALMRRAVQGSSEALGADHPHTLEMQRFLAESLLARGHTAEAEAVFRALLAIGANRMPAHNSRLVWARYGLARTLRARGEAVESRQLLQEAALHLRRSHQGRHRLQPTIEALLTTTPSAAPPPSYS